MDTIEALSILGLSAGATTEDVRHAYRRLIRDRHPDVAGAGPDATRQAARVTQAYAVITAAVKASGGDQVPVPAPSGAATPSDPTPGGEPPDAPSPDAEAVDGDTIAIGAPPAEAFAALFEAAGRVGHVAYFDRQLGILETVVRFEGGPTCSVLITLQGRLDHTDAFCTMESIEATPTPPLRPVVEALVEELHRV